MSDSTIPPITKSKGNPRSVKVAVFGGLAIMFLFAVGLIWLQRYLNAPAQEVTAKVVGTQQVESEMEPAINDDPLQFLDPEPRDPDDVGKGSHSEPQPFMSSQEKAIRARQLLLIGQQGDAIRNGVSELTTAQQTLNQTLEALLSGAEGKRIAAQPELIDQFVAIRESIASTSSPAKNLSAEADVMLAPLEHIESEPIQLEFENSLKELAEKVDSQLFTAQRGQRQLDVLLVASADVVAADLSLSQAIQQRSLELERQQIADLAFAEEKARKTIIDQGVKEATEAQKKITDAKRAVDQIAEKQKLDELKAEEEARIAALAKAQLEREFQRDLPMISRFLRPLFVEAFTQPDNRGHYVQADIKGPVSLAKLLGSGAINPTVQGRNGLYGTLGSQRERDLGSFPSYVGGARNDRAVQPTMERFQELVLKYGDLMVEKGMLAP